MVVFVVRAAYQSSNWRFTLFDDALISFAYGRTLAATGEWVWFPGADRVQGITNPLWSAVMAVVHLPGPSPQAAIIVMSIVAIVVMLALALVVHAIIASTGVTPGIALVGAGLVPFLYPLTFWTLRGMEVGFIALLLSIAILALLRIDRSPRTHTSRWIIVASTAGILAVWTRLDALVLVGGLVLMGLITGSKDVRKASAAIAISAITAAFILLLFQGHYWGDPLPNTYRPKVDGIELDERIARGLFATARAFPLWLLAIIAWLYSRSSGRTTGSQLLASLSLGVTSVAVAYSVWTGGDAWEWSLMLNRTLSIALPLAMASWLVVIAGGSQRVHPAALGLVALSGAGLGLTVNPSSLDIRLAVIGTGLTTVAASLICVAGSSVLRRRFRELTLGVGFAFATCAPGAILWITHGGLNVADDARFAFRAEELSDLTEPSAVIAVMWAGAPGYLADRPLIDMFGKSDRTIATGGPAIDPETGMPYPFIPGHNKWNYEHSIEDQRPDVIFQLGDDRSSAEARILGWGYERRCLSDGWVSYFRTDSTRVRWDRVDDC